MQSQCMMQNYSGYLNVNILNTQGVCVVQSISRIYTVPEVHLLPCLQGSWEKAWYAFNLSLLL